MMVNGNGSTREQLTHRAPWNPKEIHLGTADDCHTCKTRRPTPWQEPTDTGDPRDPADGITVGLVVALILWVVVAGFWAWWWSP